MPVQRIAPQPSLDFHLEREQPFSGKRAVVIGGGTGAPVSISALLSLGLDTSVVVAMADDGGSTGLLRERAGAIPPGDIRRCIVAMAADPSSPLATSFNYRFDYADDHALGNLILTALADITGSFPEAIRQCEEVFQTRGHVYPSTLDSIVLEGSTRSGSLICGQANIAHSSESMESVRLVPDQPASYGPALKALRSADYIVLGPGSLFTSIIPNLLVPGVLDAIRSSGARIIFVCGVGDMQGETSGFDCLDYIHALEAHGMKGLIDVAIIHKGPGRPGTPVPVAEGARVREGDVVKHVLVTNELLEQAAGRVGKVIACDLVDPIHPTWHDPEKLRVAFEEALS